MLRHVARVARSTAVSARSLQAAPVRGMSLVMEKEADSISGLNEEQLQVGFGDFVPFLTSTFLLWGVPIVMLNPHPSSISFFHEPIPPSPFFDSLLLLSCLFYLVILAPLPCS